MVLLFLFLFLILQMGALEVRPGQGTKTGLVEHQAAVGSSCHICGPIGCQPLQRAHWGCTVAPAPNKPLRTPSNPLLYL